MPPLSCKILLRHTLKHTHTRTHTHKHIPSGNKSTCLFHLFDSVRPKAINNKHESVCDRPGHLHKYLLRVATYTFIPYRIALMDHNNTAAASGLNINIVNLICFCKENFGIKNKQFMSSYSCFFIMIFLVLLFSKAKSAQFNSKLINYIRSNWQVVICTEENEKDTARGC